MVIKEVRLTPAQCAVDLGDGSERGLYVNQDYILNKLGRPHRGITLMFCYYPLDKGWPLRAQDAYKDMDCGFAWDYPYDNYFPYTGGLGTKSEGPVFDYMKDIRRHGQDVVLTMTVDPHVSDDHIIAIAKELKPYGRLQLRLNHECTGDWFSYTKRSSYQEIADFFVHFSQIMKEYAPNIKMILCGGAWTKETDPKIEMEDIFKDAVKACDIFSIDQYMALNWGWPYEVAETTNNQHKRDTVDNVYSNTEKTFNRLVEICDGQIKPMVMSELNADGDVTGAYEQAYMVKDFTDKIKNDPRKWFSAFNLYQFRDDGRLGLEITDPNNPEVGIEQPLLNTYKEIISDEFFKPGFEYSEETTLPFTLRWGSSEDATGISMQLHFDADPVFAEAYFEDDLLEANLIMELNGRWFYKAPGVKCIDFMSAFYNNRIKGECDLNLNIFAPPADGINIENQGPDWINNYTLTIKSLPKIRLRYKPIVEDEKYK